jgi:lipopolysaccharide transport system permease protein
VIDVIAEEYFFAIQNLIISILCVLPFLILIYPKLLFFLFTFKALFGLIIYLILILLNALIFSISGLISADIFQLIPVVLQLSFLMSPILYFKQTLEGKEWIYVYNPLYIPIGIVRGVILQAEEYPYFLLIKSSILSLFLTSIFIQTIRKRARLLNLYVDK